jgi:hypothetical protein
MSARGSVIMMETSSGDFYVCGLQASGFRTKPEA